MKVIMTIANVLADMVTCKIVLTSICGGGSVDIWLMCNGKGVQSDTTMDWSLGVNVVGVWRTSQCQFGSYGKNLSLKL